MYKIQQIEWRMQNPKQPGKFKFCAPFTKRTLIGQNIVGIFKKREKDIQISSVNFVNFSDELQFDNFSYDSP